MGFGYWVVQERASSRFVGMIGFHEHRRELSPSHEGVPECGWSFAQHAWGQGYATEALKAVLTWGEGHFGPVRTVCMIDPDNAASIKVAQKAGYREFARSTYKGGGTVLFER